MFYNINIRWQYVLFCCIHVCAFGGFMKHFRIPITLIPYFAISCPRRIVSGDLSCGEELSCGEMSVTNYPRRILLRRIVRSPVLLYTWPTYYQPCWTDRVDKPLTQDFPKVCVTMSIRIIQKIVLKIRVEWKTQKFWVLKGNNDQSLPNGRHSKTHEKLLQKIMCLPLQIEGKSFKMRFLRESVCFPAPRFYMQLFNCDARGYTLEGTL